MAKLRVPQTAESDPKSGSSRPKGIHTHSAPGHGQSAFGGSPTTPFPIAPGQASATPGRPKGTLNLPPLQPPRSESVEAGTTLTTAVPIVVETEAPKKPAPVLEPFTITPRPDLAVSHEDDFSDGPAELSTARIVWEDAKFLSRAALPYLGVLTLLVCGFVFRENLRELLAKADRRMRAFAASDTREEDARPGLRDIEDLSNKAMPGGAISQLDGPTGGPPAPTTEQPSAGNPGENPETEVRRRVIETNVQIARTTGQQSGSGVIFRITNDKAIILTNRSVVDSLYNIGIDSSDPTLPDVTLTFADKTSATGRVTWVGGDGLDIALVETTTYPANILPASCEGAPPVGEGETLMFADIGSTWDVGYANVGKFSSTDRGTLFEIAPEREMVVGSGTALYNTKGDLIAIAGGRFPDAVASQGSLAMMVRELKLPTH